MPVRVEREMCTEKLLSDFLVLASGLQMNDIVRACCWCKIFGRFQVMAQTAY